jgi:hypothetical protein
MFTENYLSSTPRALRVRGAELELEWCSLIYQSTYFKGDARETQDRRRGTEITPVKDSQTRIKPLALASGHGRYIKVTPERILFPLKNGRCIYMQPL